MNQQHRSAITVAQPGKRNGSERRLQGAWLVLARIAWVVLAGLSIGLFVAALPSYFAYLHGINTTSPYGLRLTPSDVRELYGLGLSLDFYAWLNIAVYTIFLLVYVLVGVVIFWRKSDDRPALLASLTLVLFPIALSTQILAMLPPTWTVLVECVEFVGDVCGSLFLYLFPSGRFAPRWTLWLMVAWVSSRVSSDFFPNTPFQNSVLSFLLFLALGQIPFILLLLLFPLSIGFAILRARLWEIDRLISRTLVYGTLTIILGLVYAGLVIGFQALLRGVISQTNDVAIVVSTLAIAALFQPLRRRIQAMHEKRLNTRLRRAAS